MTRGSAYRKLVAPATALGVALSIVLGSAGPFAAAAAPPQTMAVQLHLMSLLCQGENDFVGSDEPYIKVNGSVVWNGSNVDGGDNDPVGYFYPFDGSVQVQLWEDDGGLFGGDDLLGNWTISASDAGAGIKTLRSFMGGGRYELYYEVS